MSRRFAGRRHRRFNEDTCEVRYSGPRQSGVILTDGAGEARVEKFTNGMQVLAGDGTFQPGAAFAYPVGALFLSTVPTDPATLLGFGTWQLYAVGRVLVGVDPLTPEFNPAGKMGGSVSHTLACNEIPDCP